MPRASAQTPTHGATARWQLAIHAPQALDTLSASQPGNSLHGTGTQRLEARLITGTGSVTVAGDTAATGSATGAAIGADLGAATATGAAGVLTGLTAQALKHTLPTMSWIHQQTYPMFLILLEAAFAGLLFIGIVWWTMFSGRKGGELPPPDDSEQSERKP